MLKGRKIKEGVQLFNPYTNSDFTVSNTSWEIIKLIKKYGKEKAVQKIMKKFNIDEKNAKEDINTILTNLKKLKIKLDDIPFTVSNKKYAPRTIHFDITHKCNSKCIYCYASERLKISKDLTTKQILKLLDQMAELDTWTIMISGGEPFLRKDILVILEQLAKLEISVSILTNGMLITNNIAKKLAYFKNINMIQVSLDSCIPKHHDLHRGIKGSYIKTIKGINNLKKCGIIPHIEVTITPNNFNEIEETLEFLHNLGIKYVTIGPVFTNMGRGFEIKEKLSFNEDFIKNSVKKINKIKEKYSGSMCISPTREFYAHNIKKSVLKEEIKCGVGQSILYISPNGLVYPCLFSIHSNSFLGDIKKESLSNIWNGSSLLKNYRKLKLPDIDKCKTCDFKSIYDLILN